MDLVGELPESGCILSTSTPGSRLGKVVCERGEGWLPKGKELLRLQSRSFFLHSPLTSSCVSVLDSHSLQDSAHTPVTMHHVCQCLPLGPVLHQICLVGATARRNGVISERRKDWSVYSL